MAYINIEYGGQKTFGGYLSVDGGKQMVLSEGLLIKVDAGTHYLDFMNVPSANKTIAKANAYAGNYGTALFMANTIVEGTITEDLGENDLLVLTVVSDNNGKILDVPNYRITPLTAEGIQKLDELYQKQRSSGIQADGSNVKTEFFICLLLGWIGIHKFYKGKTLAGLVYMFTLGLAGIGWLFDTFILLIKLIMLKKR